MIFYLLSFIALWVMVGSVVTLIALRVWSMPSDEEWYMPVLGVWLWPMIVLCFLHDFFYEVRFD